MTNRQRPTLQPLDQESRATLQRLTQYRALYLVARDLRMTCNVVTRALAGLPIQQASRVLIEIRLKDFLTAANVGQVEGAATAA